MKITWIIIGTSLFVLGGFGGYSIASWFENENTPELLQIETEEQVVHEGEVEIPTSISLTHLSDDERRAFLLAVIEVNREEPEVIEDDMPELVSPIVATTTDTTDTDVGEGDRAFPFDSEKRYPIVDMPLHPANGTLRTLTSAEGMLLRFEDLDMLNGPDLHLYLASDLAASEYIDLGPVRGVRGDINYPLPEDIDLTRYPYVLHWSVPFGVLFSYADITVQ